MFQNDIEPGESEDIYDSIEPIPDDIIINLFGDDNITPGTGENDYDNTDPIPDDIIRSMFGGEE